MATLEDSMHQQKPSIEPGETGEHETFDVVICGGGLAGLCLARQLRLNHEDWSILVLDRMERPLPEAEFKVGESTIEVGAYYLATILGLRDHLDNGHLEKFGLRYFYGNDRSEFGRRGEFGLRTFLPAKTFQISRGRLENRLRELVVEGGARLEEGCSVEDVQIAAAGALHEVSYRKVDGGAESRVKARWVVDAMGRRRFLQKKFDLKKDNRRPLNAAWFRVEGAVEVDHFVAGGDTPWHQRVTDRRWYSTNHLMGPGYWVWLIPLADDKTSVGIVAADDHHPFAEYNTFEKAMSWLERNEPEVVKFLAGHPTLDFKKLRGYSYSSWKVFSTDRWTCVGEAGLFIDPYYSVGTNMIGFSNRFTEKMIELDFAGALREDFVDFANRYYLSLNDTLAASIQSAYSYLNNGRVMVSKTIWDFYVGWGLSDPQFYGETFLDPKVSSVVSSLVAPVVVAQEKMLRLFEEWAKRTDGDAAAVKYVDYFDHVPTLRDIFVKNLQVSKGNPNSVINRVRESVDRIEELAQVIFLLAVEDVLPDQAHLFSARPWLNISALSLNSDQWEKDGLFRPLTKPRSVKPLEEEIRRLYCTAAE